MSYLETKKTNKQTNVIFFTLWRRIRYSMSRIWLSTYVWFDVIFNISDGFLYAAFDRKQNTLSKDVYFTVIFKKSDFL